MLLSPHFDTASPLLPTSFPSLPSFLSISISPILSSLSIPKGGQLFISIMPTQANAGWRKAFKFFDRDNSGTISPKELRFALHDIGQDYTQEEVDQMLTDQGFSTTEELSFDQYCTLLHGTSPDANTLKRSELNSIFAAIDIDLSGYLTAAELNQFMVKLNIEMDDTEMSEMVSLYDLNGDNMITAEEFEQILKSMGYTVVEDAPESKPKHEDAKEAKSEEKKRVYPAEGKRIDLSSLSGDALEALQLFDLQNNGFVAVDDLKSAAENFKTVVMRDERDMDTDPALHWDAAREKRGLGKYVYKANHIAVIVSNVARSARFYANVMGFQQIRRPNFDKHGAWFTMGNLELHLIKGVPLVHSGDDLIVNHISIETYDISKVPAMLKELGVPFRQNVSVPKGEDGGAGGGTNTSKDSEKIVRQYFFRDPDGYYIEVCNCMLLTEYCLGAKHSLEGYEEGIKPLSLSAAATSVSIMEKWAQKGRRSVKNRDQVAEDVKNSDGSITTIAKLLGCKEAAEVDEKLLENLRTRQTVYGDICQTFSDEDLVNILKASGNDIHMSDEIMFLKADGERIFRPPAFYEDGSLKAPPSFEA